MAGRYLLMSLLFVAVVLAPHLLDPGGSPAALRPQASPPVPPEALSALEEGRYWRASRILRDYLAIVPDSSPATILLAAQAEAGWGDWSRVESLLAGRPWLDTVAGGYGWHLLGRSRLELGRWADSGQALARYLRLAVDAGERDRGLAELRRGLVLTRVGSASEAVAAFDRAARLLPQLGDWSGVLAAEALAAAGDTAGVRARLDGLGTELAREWGWRIRVAAFRQAGDVPAALAAAEAAANALSDAGRRAAAWQTVGELRLVREETGAARAALRRAMAAAPLSRAAVDAARLLGEIPGATPEDRLLVGRLYLRHGNLERGITGLEAYLEAGLGSALERDQIRFELANALFRAGRYAEAERRLLDLAEDPASSRIGARALFLAGRAQYRQGRETAGRATFLRTAERFPNEAAAAEALFLLADLDHDDGRLESARRFYRRAVEARPDANEAGLAAMRLGGMEYIDGDYEAAARIFEDYRKHHPRGRRFEQATFWAGKAYAELGRMELARRRFREVRRQDPFSYYGIRAAELLGEPFWDVPMDVSPLPNETIEGDVAAALVRLDLLREVGLDDAADFEVGRLKGHFGPVDGALYALAEALNARGYTFTGIGLGWEIFDREKVWNPRLLRIIYPFPYQRLILAEAREHGLDPFLVAGLIRQESMFNAGIRSPAGAVGLMQIMPATGRALARRAGIAGFEPELLERPEINLHLGMLYLQDLLGRYGGRFPPAFAAYNAGPHRVTRWSAFPEFGDDELFTERIPYAETRHYVKVVQQNHRLYSALYAPLAREPAEGE